MQTSQQIDRVQCGMQYVIGLIRLKALLLLFVLPSSFLLRRKMLKNLCLLQQKGQSLVSSVALHNINQAMSTHPTIASTTLFDRHKPAQPYLSS